MVAMLLLGMGRGVGPWQYKMSGNAVLSITKYLPYRALAAGLLRFVSSQRSILKSIHLTAMGFLLTCCMFGLMVWQNGSLGRGLGLTAMCLLY